MKTNTHTSFTPSRDGRKQIRPGGSGAQGPVINWPVLWARLAAGLSRLFTTLRYLFGQPRSANKGSVLRGLQTDAAGWRRRWQWLQVAIVLFAFYYVTQKDVQFSIHLQAPVGERSERGETTGSRTERLGLAQAVSLPTAARPATAVATSTTPTGNLTQAQTEAYIRRFARVAISEMDKYGIPAAVSMAQALLESQAGQTPAAREFNNHFGQPLAGQHYESAWANWRAHSLYLRDEYPQLFSLGEDYRSWAEALQRAGYNTDRSYAADLIQLIRTYQLDQLAEQEY